MRRQIVDQHAELIEANETGFHLSDEFRGRLVRRVRGPGRNLCGVIWSLYTETGFGKKGDNRCHDRKSDTQAGRYVANSDT